LNLSKIFRDKSSFVDSNFTISVSLLLEDPFIFNGLPIIGQIHQSPHFVLQSQLESHGGVFFADGRLTIADLKAFVILRWLSSGMLDHIPSDLVAREAPKLDEFMHRVAGLPAIAKHYERRAVS
jgi:hypothetical protein